MPRFSVLHYLPESAQTPLSWRCHPTISSSVALFSCPQSFPVSGSFLMSQLFASGGQSIGASALVSAFPMNIQEWFPVGLNGLISLLFKGLSPQPRFPDPGIESRSSVLQADSLLSEPPRKPYNPVRVCILIASVVPNSANLWTAAHQASLSMGFFKQDYWSGLPHSPPRGSFQPRNWTVSCIAGGFFTCWATREAQGLVYSYANKMSRAQKI